MDFLLGTAGTNVQGKVGEVLRAVEDNRLGEAMSSVHALVSREFFDKAISHPFGSIKRWMGQRNFFMRRIENVRGEFSLTALAYNIRRALTLVGVTGLMRAINA